MCVCARRLPRLQMSERACSTYPQPSTTGSNKTSPKTSHSYSSRRGVFYLPLHSHTHSHFTHSSHSLSHFSAVTHVLLRTRLNQSPVHHDSAQKLSHSAASSLYHSRFVEPAHFQTIARPERVWSCAHKTITSKCRIRPTPARRSTDRPPCSCAVHHSLQ